MRTVVITTLAELHAVVSSHQEHWSRWFYRGQSRADHQLVPKAGRPEFAEKDDARMFEAWKRHAVAFLPVLPRTFTDWDLLAVAQHHGLATRLLDWSFNPLAAAYFALEEANVDGRPVDGAIYAHYSEAAPVDPRSSHDPFMAKGIQRVAPSSVAPRILRQGGIFTLHGPPTRSMEAGLPHGDRLEKLMIPAANKRPIAIQLSHYGVNQMSLFPDLDGLSRHINWSFVTLPYPPSVLARRRGAGRSVPIKRRRQR